MQEMNKKPGRGGAFWTAMGLLTGLLVWRLAGPALTGTCSPRDVQAGTIVVQRPPTGLPYDDLPGVDLSGLSPRQKFTVLHRAATAHCDCGCKETVAECRHSDMDCKKCLKVATQIRDEVARTPLMEPAH